MAYELKEGQGALHRNDYKDGNDARPDYKGSILINGEEYELAAWLRIAKSGKKYMSLQAQSKREEQERPAPKARPQRDDVDSDIPFADPYKGRRSSVV